MQPWKGARPHGRGGWARVTHLSWEKTTPPRTQGQRLPLMGRRWWWRLSGQMEASSGPCTMPSSDNLGSTSEVLLGDQNSH